MSLIPRTLILTVLVCGLTCAEEAPKPDPNNPNPAPNAEKPGEPGANPAEHDMAEMMARWEAASTPGEEHAALAEMIGEWKVESSMYGMGPEPLKTDGKATFRWLIEGRWLAQELTTTMMGQAYTGFGITGYDNFKKQYVGSWVDSMSTALLTMGGNYTEDGKTLLEHGLMDEPMTGEHDKTVQYVTRTVSDDEFVFEIHDLAIGGDNTLVMSIRYTRIKK